VTVDNRRVRCATCGSEVTLSSSTRTSVRTREARELLERWANDRLLSEHDPEPATDYRTGAAHGHAGASHELSAAAHEEASIPHASQASPEAQRAESPREPAAQSIPRPRAKFRIDRPHPTGSAESDRSDAASAAEKHISAVRERERAAAERLAAPAAAFERTAPRAASTEGRRAAPPASASPAQRYHQPHASVPPPHFNVQAAIRAEDRPRSNWTSVVGQLLAYGGVGLLTVGSSLVLWGYFGGPENYAPTGWLITTAGQMLLFLGVVTLVSGGMEQTTEEVSRRIDMLGDRIAWYEQTAREPRHGGPHLPAERYASDAGMDLGDDLYAEHSEIRARGSVR